MDPLVVALLSVLGVAAEGLVLGYGTEWILRLFDVHERRGGNAR